MKIKTFITNPLQENTYLLIDEESKECVVVDAGFLFDYEEEEFCKYLETEGLKLTRILNTHMHLDHCFGNDFLYKRFGLKAEANKRVGQLSKGYKQRVGLAQAMIGDPELLILDEPTTGLDPNQLEDIRALIREMGKERTVILSTHILQEVKQMCSRVIIIDHGEIKVDKPVSEIEDLEETFKQATKNE